jgi:hypothetical protein
MKKLLLILSVLIIASCKKDSVTPTPASTNPSTTTSSTTAETFDPSKATLLKQGTLTGINHTASGTVKVYDANGSKTVYFETFSSQDGPDLKVYLSKDIDAKDYIKLGVLKSTSGMQSYAVPATTDVVPYTYVHIWCEKFTVVFARAEIK